MSLRLIATEEAFAPQEYLDAYIDATRDTDTAVARYLRMYYQKPDFARQLTDFDERLTVMDRNGVAMQVLSLTSPGVQAFGAAQGTELAALANDQLANVVRRHPTRFAGLAAVAPQSPEHAAQEIARAMSRLQLNGIIINSHTHGEFLDDPKFWPMLEAAVAHDAPIYLHPAFPPDAMLAPYSKHGMMGALWGFQAECSLHAVRMILGGHSLLADAARQPLPEHIAPWRAGTAGDDPAGTLAKRVFPQQFFSHHGWHERGRALAVLS